MSQITSEEVNYLIYRYLQEAGFVHSAFTFGQESFITRSDIKPATVPPGMLVQLLQRGLQYTSIEFHLNEDGSEKECSRPWSLLDPHVCAGKAASAALAAAPGAGRTISMAEGMGAGRKDSGSGKKRKKEAAALSAHSAKKAGAEGAPKEKLARAGAERPPMVERFLESEVVVLTGHQSEVIGCAWNPAAATGLLASVAGDDTARIWRIPPAAGSRRLDPGAIVGHELVLSQGHAEAESKDITTLDWSPDGRALAVGCYDGKAMLWSADGRLLAQLDQFRGPVFALRWSPSGRYIAGAGLDHCGVVWAAADPQAPLHVFGNHSSPTMDLDWRDDSCFATCTTEKTIYIYTLPPAAANGTAASTVRVLRGHDDEINSVRWSPDGQLLASCSDDNTARVWAVGAADGETEALWVLAGHTKDIYCLEWSPVAADGILATASFDATVRLWDASRGACLHVLRRHTEPVYALSFSPDGRFLASGSLDETLNIWSVQDGRLLRTYDSGRGGIFEIAWNPAGDRLAACTSDSTVCVLDFRP